MTFYRRHLPHWHPEGAAIFLTWRLQGTLPSGFGGQRFVHLDREMDQPGCPGPRWLADTRIADAVVETLLLAEREWKLCRLTAWVVMPNHVHVLLWPLKPVWEITRAIKNTSGRKANQLLGRAGVPFWQHESYDHWVRDTDESNRIIRYIETNPVRAGLVERIEDWPWSSAFVAPGHVAPVSDRR